LWSNSRWIRGRERGRGAVHLLCALGRGREKYIAEFLHGGMPLNRNKTDGMKWVLSRED
jgi:hypothetical protein